MQSTTTARPPSASRLPLEAHVTVAADEISRRMNLPPSIALRTLAAVYQRASLHVAGTAEQRHELSHHLIRSAMCARRQAVAIEEATGS